MIPFCQSIWYIKKMLKRCWKLTANKIKSVIKIASVIQGNIKIPQGFFSVVIFIFSPQA